MKENFCTNFEDFLMSSSEAFKRAIKKRFIVSTSQLYFPTTIFPPSVLGFFLLAAFVWFAFVFLAVHFFCGKESMEKTKGVLIKLRGVHLEAAWHIIDQI